MAMLKRRVPSPAEIYARSSDEYGCFLFAMLLGLVSLAGWVTHFVWFFSKLRSDIPITFGQFFLGLIGCILPPVGVVNGIVVWFS